MQYSHTNDKIVVSIASESVKLGAQNGFHKQILQDILGSCMSVFISYFVLYINLSSKEGKNLYLEKHN